MNGSTLALLSAAGLAGVALSHSRSHGSRTAIKYPNLFREGTTIPQEVWEEYTCGKCMWLALALHDRTGWPIRAEIALDTYKDQEEEWISHAYVYTRTPDGKLIEIDIAGPTTDRMPRFGGGSRGSEVRDFTRTAFLRFLACSDDRVRVSLEEADHILDQYVIPLIRAEGLHIERRA